MFGSASGRAGRGPELTLFMAAQKNTARGARSTPAPRMSPLIRTRYSIGGLGSFALPGSMTKV